MGSCNYPFIASSFLLEGNQKELPVNVDTNPSSVHSRGVTDCIFRAMKTLQPNAKPHSQHWISHLFCPFSRSIIHAIYWPLHIGRNLRTIGRLERTGSRTSTAGTIPIPKVISFILFP